MQEYEEKNNKIKRFFIIFSLIVAGEAVFSLPFHLTRYFRPTLLEVFKFSNTDLGMAQGVYGIVAMISYFPGGILADKFSARNLILISLVSTSLGGGYMSTIPNIYEMALLWGWWGISSILFLWAALIRSIREWGDSNRQGIAYGILDSGRGLTSLVITSLALLVLSHVMPQTTGDITALERMISLQNIIYFYTFITLGAAILVWVFVPNSHLSNNEAMSHRVLYNQIIEIIKMPKVWLISFIVVNSYITWKGLDNLGLYAIDVFSYSEVEAAWLSTTSTWIRPLAAIVIGLLADRFRTSRIISACFLTTTITFGFLWLAPINIQTTTLLFLQVIISCLGVFGLRAIYFALIEESSIPLSLTGVSVGVISFIGFTPDVFVGVVQGYLLDTYPGVVGHQYFWLFITTASFFGVLASLLLTNICKKQKVIN